MNIAIATIQSKPHVLNAFLGVIMLSLLLSYVYLLSLTVVHVVMRKELDRDITTLHSEISTLEAEYMTAQHKISTTIADRTDLTVTNEKIFINKQPPDLVLSSTDER